MDSAAIVIETITNTPFVETSDVATDNETQTVFVCPADGKTFSHQSDLTKHVRRTYGVSSVDELSRVDLVLHACN